MTGRGTRAAGPPDLRLAAFALGVWAAALACLWLPATAGMLVAAAAAAAAGVGGAAGMGHAAAGGGLGGVRAAGIVGVAGAGGGIRGVCGAAAVRGIPWALRVPGGNRAVRVAGADGVSAWRPRRRALRRIVVAVLLGVCCGALATAVRVGVRDAEPLAGLARLGATVHMRLTVTDDPRPTGGAGDRPAGYALPADAGELRAEGAAPVRLGVRVLVLASGTAWGGLLPGTAVMATGRLLPARRGELTAAVLAVRGPPDAVFAAPWWQRAAGTVRQGLRRACAPLPAGPGGLLPGLVVGDTGRLDPIVDADFRATGLTHLVAVSGANIAILLGVVLLTVRWCRAGPRLAAVLCAVAVLGFVIVARPSPSVLRAAAMGGLGLVALASGRARAAVPGLAAVVVLLILFDPEQAAEAGFALSVAATGGLLLIAPGLRDALRRRRVPAGLAEALAVPAAAELACAPIIAGLYGTVSLVAVPANLLAEPAVAPATVIGVCAAGLSVVWPAGSEFLAWLASWPARWLVAVAHAGASVPANTLGWPGGIGGGVLLAIALSGLVLGLRTRTGRRVALAVLLGTALGTVPVLVFTDGWPPAGAIMVMCDVGQGDALVLPLARGRAVVVDAGPEPVATDRCLRDLGVDQIPLLVISHFHLDHVGGLSGVLRGRTVGEMLVTELPEPVTERTQALALAASQRVPVREPGWGWTWAGGRLGLSLLGPAGRLDGTDSDPNNNSLVLMADVAGVRILLTGDAEAAEQSRILTGTGEPGVRADVLKVAHHGSALQDDAFLSATAPAVALVSVGAGNSYGQPSTATLDLLRGAGTRLWRTDVDGDLAVVPTRSGLGVVSRSPPPGSRPP